MLPMVASPKGRNYTNFYFTLSVFLQFKPRKHKALIYADIIVTL